MAKFNPVAKHAKKYNKAVVFLDRKREYKKTGDLGRQCNYDDDDFYDSADGYLTYERQVIQTTQNS